MRLVPLTSAALILLSSHAQAASKSDEKAEKPLFKACTIRSSTSGSFFDLTPIHVLPPDPQRKSTKDEKAESWKARGHDYGANFTINFCGPVIEELTDVVGVEKGLWRNVSAYYEMGGKTYSMGQQNDYLVLRGRKLVLNYTNGSPCTGASHPHPLRPRELGLINPTPRRPRPALAPKPLDPTKLVDDEEDDNDDQDDSGDTSPPLTRRKNTVISLLCEREPLAAKAAVSFVASPDDCTYIFEVRTSAACPAVNVEKQQIGPSAVFGVIAMVAILVYIIGGIVYQRTVMHQRGWRQLPNYHVWAGMVGFISDFFVILTSSCLRLIPGRRGSGGYNRLGENGGEGSPRGGFGARGRGRDDENRLIDQLDEEWED